MKFIITNPNDFIQSHWIHNKFYEQEELAYTKQFLPPHPVIVDVGSNIGNHAIYFDKFYSPRVVYCIEPNPEAYKLLLMNSALNYCHTLNFDYLNIVLGKTTGFASLEYSDPDNLGNSEYAPRANGNVVLRTGDSIFETHVPKVDLLKIDVEGMEEDVISGFSNLVKTHRPLIYIEVKNNNTWFNAWLESNQYQIIETLSAYESYTNYLLKPIDM